MQVEENREQTQKAVRIIANHRESKMLQSFVDSGFVPDLPMDAADAYKAFEIGDRTCEDDLVISAYAVATGDNPHNVEYYNRALVAIANDRGSTVLRDKLAQIAPQAMEVVLDEPVGLENIGNTCYLNSLLQFLFTMLELRKIVLNFNEFRMDPTDENLAEKKVGQRKVTKKEAQMAQNFVQRLSELFQGMIQAPSSSIRPEKQLAKLALETDNAKEKIRRKSTLTGDRPNLGSLDNQTYPGPLQLPQPQLNGVTEDTTVLSPNELEPHKSLDQEMKDVVTDDAEMPDLIEMNEVNDNSSEATLVSRPNSIGTPPTETPSTEEQPSAEQQQSILDNKENLSPTKAEGSPKHGDVGMEHPMPLAPASPSKINAQAGALAHKDHEIKHEPLPQPMYAPPPGKPPPVPPRKPVELTTDILEAYARQQDVTEVLAHVFFQLSCAMRPTGVDKSGEQQDEVHDMFFGQSISHVLPEKEKPASTQFFSVITRVANEPRDIYEALDTEYDLAVREGGTSAFTSIEKPPPIFSIALDRVTWDPTDKRTKKLDNHVEVPERLFLDRYLEASADSDLFQRRKQAWQLKRELNTLNERRKILEAKHANAADLPALFDEARIALEALQSTFPDTPDESSGEGLGIKPDTITHLGVLAEDLRIELEGMLPFPSHRILYLPLQHSKPASFPSPATLPPHLPTPHISSIRTASTPPSSTVEERLVAIIGFISSTTRRKSGANTTTLTSPR